MNELLSLPGLSPLRYVETPDTFEIYVDRRSNALTACLTCRGPMAPNGARPVSYADMPIRGKPVLIIWDRQRFKCRTEGCGKTATDSHAELHDDFMMTKRLYDWIGSRSLTMTFAAIATDIGLDERTVRRVFEHWSEAKLGALNFATPQWLGIDEVHLLNSARGVLTNISERTLIDLLPNRSQDTMARRIIGLKDRDRIEVVAMDMWTPYRQIAATLLPKAVVVIDKWHVTKYADAGIETIRKGFRAELTAPQRRRLVKDRFLLLSRARNLRPEQTMILQTWTNHFPTLAAAYEAKEAFYGIYDCQGRRSAEVAFDNWEQSLTPVMRVAFKDLLSATKNWREPIFNYFDRRITNAFTEAMNGLIKITNRNGRGYSFPVLRARMLLSREAVRVARIATGVSEPAASTWSHEIGFKKFTTKSMGRPQARLITHRQQAVGIDIATMTQMIEDHWLMPLSTRFAG
jgi:transposase